MRRRPISNSIPGTDVTIVGGGVIGLACAWRSAQRGASVTVVDERVGRGASWAAAGMLAPVTEVHHGEEALLRLNLQSADLYGDFAAELEDRTGSSVGYRRCGTLLVARDRDDNTALEEIYRYQLGLGLSVQRLRSSECRDAEPALSPNVRGGILVEGDHQVDNRALVRVLESACLASGVRFERSRVLKLQLEQDRVAALQLSDGTTMRCDHCVMAAGVWSATIDGIPAAARLPLRPVKGQLLHLRNEGSRPSSAVALSGHNIRGVDVYVVARADGRVVIGATSEEQGFDTTVRAGAVLELLRDAYDLVPGVSELELTETVAGLRPATPDNAPVIGPSALDGLIMATGHYRNGVLLAPVTGEAIADVVDSGKLSEEFEPFSPRRFEGSVSSSKVAR